jgi:hypothetical protein
MEDCVTLGGPQALLVVVHDGSTNQFLLDAMQEEVDTSTGFWIGYVRKHAGKDAEGLCLKYSSF